MVNYGDGFIQQRYCIVLKGHTLLMKALGMQLSAMLHSRKTTTIVPRIVPLWYNWWNSTLLVTWVNITCLAFTAWFDESYVSYQNQVIAAQDTHYPFPTPPPPPPPMHTPNTPGSHWSAIYEVTNLYIHLNNKCGKSGKPDFTACIKGCVFTPSCALFIIHYILIIIYYS